MWTNWRLHKETDLTDTTTSAGQMAEFQLAKTRDIAPGQAHVIEINGKQVALFNYDGKFFTLDNHCTHRNGAHGTAHTST